jgi:hypothetical protein
MKTLYISRYLCGVMTIAFLLVSTITYIPEAEWKGELLMWTFAFCAFFFAGVSLFLSALRQRNPESRLFKSRLLHFTLFAFALLMTLFLLLGVAG